MRRVSRQHIGSHHQDADRAIGAAGAGQFVQCFGDPGLGLGVIEPDIGIMQRRPCAQTSAERLARPLAVALHQQPDHVGQVLFRAGQPVLQGEEIGAYVLRGAGNEAQQFRQLPQHLHLPGAARLRGFAAAAQALQHGDHAIGLPRHVEAANAGEAHHFAGGQAADHGIAGIATRFERRQHGADVILEKQHGRDHDISAGDIGVAFCQRDRIAVPFVSGVDDEVETGKFGAQQVMGALGGTGEMAVHGHDHDAHRRRFSVRNALSHHRASRL